MTAMHLVGKTCTSEWGNILNLSLVVVQENPNSSFFVVSLPLSTHGNAGRLSAGVLRQRRAGAGCCGCTSGQRAEEVEIAAGF